MMQTIVRSTQWVTPQVRVLELSELQGSDTESAPSGSFIEIEVPYEGWRSYSLINRPGEHGFKVAVQRAQGAASAWLTDTLQVGQTLAVRGPHLGFDLCTQDDQPVLMIAGGIGITPFLGMMQILQAQGREWNLIYAVRVRDAAPFADDLACYGEHVTWHVDEELGRFLDVSSVILAQKPGTHVYVCGPLPMMQAAADVRDKRPDLRFHEQQAVQKN